MKKTIRLTVNSTAVSAEVEPRLQLAEFLREHLMLTGTHIGCEHGVCGACTVEIDGAPSRSCIVYAVAVSGADVRTIEGFDGDVVMGQLREAFSAEHALQCGYCTPGMLVTARDIVMRLPDADEARIRKELAGNLCRCTGYVGIVRAIQSVLAARNQDGAGAPRVRRHPGSEQPTAEAAPQAGSAERKKEPTAYRPETRGVQSEPAQRQSGLPTLHQSFTVDHPRDQVWEFFGRLGDVTLCLPGTELIGTPANDHVETKIRVKVGPIVAEFVGAADALRDRSSFAGSIRGSARDARSSSTTRGEIRYVLFEEPAASTRVDVDVSYALTGPLAQFSRSNIVQDIARRMTAAFAQNLEERLRHPRETGAAPARSKEIDAGSLFAAVVWERVKAFFRAMTRR